MQALTKPYTAKWLTIREWFNPYIRETLFPLKDCFEINLKKVYALYASPLAPSPSARPARMNFRSDGGGSRSETG
jgi:hypothetical protein